MAYRIAVLDDEEAELRKTEEILSLYGKSHPGYEFKISCYSEMKKFMDAVRAGGEHAEWAFDILLMDIYLPDGNGIKSAGILRQKGFEGVIIFKSSSLDNAMDAFSVGAMQYLVKPVSQEKLEKAIEKAVEKVRCGSVLKTKEEINRRSGNSILRGKNQENQTGGRHWKHILKSIFSKWKL